MFENIIRGFYVGPNFLREFSIGINYIELITLIEFFFVFVLNYKKSEKTSREKFTVTTSIVFLLLAICRVFYMIFDYYISEYVFVLIAWIFLLAGVFLLLVGVFKGVLGNILKHLPHKSLYIISFIAVAVTGLIFRLIIGIVWSQSIWVITLVFTIGILLIIPPLYQFNKWLKKAGGYIKKYTQFVIITIPLVILGLTIGSTWMILPVETGWYVKIIGHVMVLSGFVLFAMALMSVPSFAEFGWEEKIQHLYIITTGGLCIYQYLFTELKELEADAELFGGGLTGVIMIVQEMTQSEKKLKIIRQEKRNLLLDYGRYITAVIIAEEDLKIIHEKLEQFTKKFEEKFENVLKSWDGNLEAFSETKNIILEIFKPQINVLSRLP